MAVRKILLSGDKRLHRKAVKVKQFTPALKKLADDMLETVRHHQGVGLAGPQVGVMQRIFVAEIPASRGDGEEPHPQSGKSYILVNPELVSAASEMVEGKEGCLSIPNWFGRVERPAWVELKARDVKGRKIKLKVDDLLARIFMHELDHLNGILFTDHIRDPQKLWELLPEAEPEKEPAPAASMEQAA